jgi:hypothetical protein
MFLDQDHELEPSNGHVWKCQQEAQMMYNPLTISEKDMDKVFANLSPELQQKIKQREMEEVKNAG